MEQILLSLETVHTSECVCGPVTMTRSVCNCVILCNWHVVYACSTSLNVAVIGAVNLPPSMMSVCVAWLRCYHRRFHTINSCSIC